MARKLVIAALIVAALPTAAASAATLHLQAPKSVDREEMFRVVSFGKAQPERAYYLSVVFQDDNQGACAESLEKEVTTNKHFELHYLRNVTTDQDGRFEVRSRKIFGGEKASTGRFCGYLTNQDGTKNKDRVVRRIEFT